MRQTNVTAMVEAGVMAAIAIVFALIINYVPILGGLLNIVWAVPIILVGVRRGVKWSIMTACVSGILILCLTNPLLAVGTVGLFGLLGIALGHALRSGVSPGKGLLWGTIGILVSLVAIIGISCVLFGLDQILVQIQTQIDLMDASMKFSLEIYQNLGMSEANIANLTEFMENFITLFKHTIPAGMVGAAVMITYMNLFLSRVVLRRLGYSTPHFPPAKEWSFP